MMAPELPTISTLMNFDEASRIVVDFLKAHVPLGYWAVTRFDGERQLYLEVRDDVYGLEAGGSHPWSGSFCVRMVAGDAPRIAADVSAEPAYDAVPVADQIDIGAYVGIPITYGDGTLFGTLCGLDPDAQSEALAEQRPLLELLTNLLSMILASDLARTEEERRRERAEMAADTDVLTGLLNRRGWERALQAEEGRYRRFGDPAVVILVDLDHLKETNDTIGHAAGDVLIQSAAQVIESLMRPYDYVARLGGDEFAVLATDTNMADADAIVERIRTVFDDVDVDASIGHAPYTIGRGFAGAVAAADRAMYEDKRRRRASDT